MGGLGFIHLGFLAAGAAVAVPIVLHLLFRQRARRVEIGTLHFLRVVLQDQARRRKLRRWLLLALRCAGVLLLALLFARPFWRAAETCGSEREVAILIDRSASMAAGTEGASPFDKAQRQAADLIAGLPDGSKVRLAYFDSDEVAPTQEAKIDAAMRPSLAGTDYTKALGWARDIVVASRRLKRQVFLLTDLQKCGLGPPVANAFPPNAEFELIDVGRPLTTNLAVEDVLAEQTELRTGAPVIVTARVFNSGVFPARDVRVRLSLEGKPPVETDVSIDGQSRKLVRFEVPVKDAGLYHGFVEVPTPDVLPFDNRRWLAFLARLPDRVLLIDGEPGPSVFGNETYYLETALRLRLPGDEPAASASPYEPMRVPWGGEGGSLPDLGPYQCVALCNVADLAPSDAGALSRFVESGGNLIIFTGDRVQAGAYAALEQAKLLPARVQGPAEIGSYRFSDWSKSHPILSPFTDPQYGDLRTLRFQKITRLEPEPEARVLGTTQGGAPLVLERSPGKGRCILFAFPADNAWGDWAIHRLYLPLVHQLLGYLTSRLPETNPVKSDRAGRTPALLPGVTIENGHAMVCNVDASESEIERTTVAQLREHYGLPGVTKTVVPEDKGPESLAVAGERPDELWRTVAWVLLIVLLVETYVGNRTHA
jgi:Aerotolerance regulator N-terminal/von Willebrand factor type A domain